jgi:hypothetical protein
VAVVRRACLFLVSRKLSSARMRGLARNPEQSRSEHRSFRPADRGGGLVSGIASWRDYASTLHESAGRGALRGQPRRRGRPKEE